MNNTKTKFYFIMLITALITYKQTLGINAFVISLIITGDFLIYTNFHKAKKWKMAALLWVISGLGLALSYLDIGITLFIVTGLNFFAVHYSEKINFPSSIIQSIISFYTGIIRFFQFRKVLEINTSAHQGKDILKKILIIMIPLFVVCIFLKLYQAANPKFKDYTSFLNLEFIEWQFLIFYGVLLIFTYGFFFFKPSQKILELDASKKIDLISENFSSEKQITDTQFDWQIGTTMVLSLIVLLISFVGVDIYSLSVNSTNSLSHSQTVHQGINILIISIILVVIIVLYLFRGGINFKKSNTLKFLTYSWLSLNCILVFLIAIKNYNYITEWGLTHKRMGVFLYLFLCLIGLIFTGLKIRDKTNTYLLINKVAISFLSVLVMYSVLNWNGIIAKYNLNEANLPTHKIDMTYLINLGPETYPYLTDYINDNQPISNYNLNLIKGRIIQLNEKYNQNWKSFPSYTAGGLNAFKYTKSNKITKSTY